MITGIASKNEIEFNIVDLVIGLCLESLENDLILLIGDL
jgi:hypothetical protein